MGDSIETRLGYIGAGALLAVAMALLGGLSDSERVSGAPVAFWLADRDGCAVYGLDEKLVLARRVRVEWPTAVIGRPDGGAWVLRSCSGASNGSSSLLRLDSNGVTRSETAFSACEDLDSVGDGSAIVLEKHSGEEGNDRVLRCEEGGRVEVVYSGRGLTCIAGSKDSIAVGDADGRLVRISLDPRFAVTSSVDLHDRISDLESGPNDDVLWALTTSECATIHRLDGDLLVRWSVGAGSPATSFASDSDRDRIWLVDEPVIRSLDEHGVVELEKADLPIVGPTRAAHDLRGGLVLATPGCVLSLDSTGRMRPGQGGFAHLVDVDRVP